MKKNPYQTLMEQIHPPAGLNDRVLFAARHQAHESSAAQAPMSRRKQMLLRGAVCAACALALVLGTVTLRPAGQNGTDGSTALIYSFGLTAYAADTGETTAPDGEGVLTFRTTGEMNWSESGGLYTGFLFQVTGDGVETVSLSLDRGELYRWRDGESVRLGKTAREAYDVENYYGFWVPGGEAAGWEENPRAAAQESLQALNGATLTVTVTFTSGEQGTKTYRLSAGENTLTAAPLQGAQTVADRFYVLPYGGDQDQATESARRGSVIFSSGNWAGGGEENGTKVSQVFCVQGEDIQTVSATLDRGAFWRGYIYAGESKEDLPDEHTLARQLFGDLADTLEGCNIQGRYMTLQWDLENGFTENYDPRFCYGLRILPQEVEELRQAEEHKSVFDFFDGAELTVTVTFTDGSVETQKFCLDTGRFQGTLDEATGLYVDLTEDTGTGDLVPGVRAQRLDWPVQTEKVQLSLPFGSQWKAAGQAQVRHDGIDIPTAEGTPILAAADGTVMEIGFDAQRGNYVILDHGDGLTTLYGQCRNLAAGLTEGDTVRAGEMIAAVGSTGMSTGAHLHFEVCKDGQPQNPANYFDSTVQAALGLDEY